jgi:hypothetical protein
MPLDKKLHNHSLHVMPAPAAPVHCSHNCHASTSRTRSLFTQLQTAHCDMIFKQQQFSFISDIQFCTVFTSVRKLLQFENTSTNVLNDNPKLLQLKHLSSDVFRPFLMGYSDGVHMNTGYFKESFTTLKAYRNLYRGHTQHFELSKCSETHRVLPRIVISNCFDLFFRFLLPHYQWKSH